MRKTVMLCLVFMLVPWAMGDTITQGGTWKGTNVYGEIQIKQKEYVAANKLTYTSTNSQADINGWLITTQVFDESSSVQASKRAIDVEAWDGVVYKDQVITLTARHWCQQTPYCDNCMGWSKVTWHQDLNHKKLIPDHEWVILYPEPISGTNDFRHTIQVINRDANDVLEISGMTFLADMALVAPLSTVVFPGPTHSFSLNPGDTWSFDLVTPSSSFVGGYVYMTYAIHDPVSSEVLAQAWGGHSVTEKPSLCTDVCTMEMSVGGSVNFSLNAGSDQGGRFYILFGSISGTTPGTPLPGGMATLPLNWDIFTNLLFKIMPMLPGFYGNLTATGEGSATMTLGPTPAAAGLTLYFAYALDSPWDFASNPVEVYLLL